VYSKLVFSKKPRIRTLDWPSKRIAPTLRDDLKAMGVTRSILFEKDADNVEPCPRLPAAGRLGAVTPAKIIEKVDRLVGGRCDRRCLRALRAILSGWPLSSGLPDSKRRSRLRPSPPLPVVVIQAYRGVGRLAFGYDD
jgi:hypothetical protein